MVNLKLFLIKIITQLVYLVNLFIVKRTKIKDSKNFIIFGRGESLNKFTQYHADIKSENIILSNFGLNNILKTKFKKIIRKYKIILMHNIIEERPSFLSIAGLSVD